MASLVKRRPVYGTVRDGQGRKTVMRQASVTAALEQAEWRIDDLERAARADARWDERRATEVKEAKEGLARLQNSWWVRLGELLRVVRIRP